MEALRQVPHAVFMVRPAAFGYHPEAALTNRFQQKPKGISDEDIRLQAVKEFDRMADLLRAYDVEVHVANDTETPPKPDAVFPNNWISFHHDGTVVLYPMQAPLRRTERRRELLVELNKIFRIHRIVDLSHYEDEEKFLEGTGSLVFDYPNRIAYAARSARTHEALVHELCQALQFRPVLFNATDEYEVPVYHTNVVLSIGTRLMFICLDAIKDEADRETLLNGFQASGRRIVAVSYEQVKAFAANTMEVQTRQGNTLWVMSESAYQSLLPGQLDAITRVTDILVVPVPTIERYGGGSVRCMMAGIFNPSD